MIKRIVQTANYLGGAVLLLLVFYIAADVGLRYVFNRPLKGSMDIGELGLSVIVFFGLSYTALQRGHIRVDILVSRLSERKQAILEAVNSFIGIVVYGYIGWQGFVRALYSKAVGDTSGVLYIPTYPFRLLVPLGSLLLCLVLVSHIVESFQRVREGT